MTEDEFNLTEKAFKKAFNSFKSEIDMTNVTIESAFRNGFMAWLNLDKEAVNEIVNDQFKNIMLFSAFFKGLS